METLGNYEKKRKKYKIIASLCRSFYEEKEKRKN